MYMPRSLPERNTSGPIRRRQSLDRSRGSGLRKSPIDSAIGDRLPVLWTGAAGLRLGQGCQAPMPETLLPTSIRFEHR